MLFLAPSRPRTSRRVCVADAEATAAPKCFGDAASAGLALRATIGSATAPDIPVGFRFRV